MPAPGPFHATIEHRHAIAQVRHGDKYTDGSKILQLADYVRELRQRYPRLKRVWLMTEDASVISQATHDYPEYEWFRQ